MKIIYSDVFREIKKSPGRFVSLLLIILLGVAFYAGMRSTGPDMQKTADSFYDRSNLADIRIISTLGLTEDDVSALSKVKGVKRADGTYTTDLICKTEDSQLIVKLMAIQNGINDFILKSGKLPEKDNECLLDDYYMKMHDYNLGDKISFVSGDDTPLEDKIRNSVFTVTGSFTSAAYLSYDKGTTSLGSGTLEGIVLVKPDAFSLDCFTEIDIIADDAGELLCYSDEYDDLIGSVMDEIEKIEEKRCLERYSQVIEEPLNELNDAKRELADAKKELEDARREAADGKKQLEDGRKELQQKKDELEDFKESIGAGLPDIIRQAMLALAQPQIDAAEKQIKDAEAEIETHEQELKDAEAKIKDGEAEIADAEEEIADGEAELAKIEVPEWYILDRSYLQEYTSYNSDAKRISNLGKVFPLVFFIVAALVCLTTMTRMVDEERTQIGTLKALGYTKFTIAFKYIVYALIATVFGSVAGVLLGGKILPVVIINVYKMLYPNLEGILTPYNLEYSLAASLAALVCIQAATIAACFASLAEVPANLMRPVAPKQAKRLLIERVAPVWKRIPFTWKNALRNFFRYKKRLFMTLFGIIGSTALLIVGFGLKDAINTILFAQYGEINLYNEVLSIDNDAAGEDIEELSRILDEDDRITGHLLTYQTLKDAESENSDEILAVYVFVPEKTDGLNEFIDIHERIGKAHIDLKDDSVVISEKMSRVLNVGVGDTITLSSDNSGHKTVKIGAVMENYLYHYVYMTPKMYEKLYGEAPDYRSMVVSNTPESEGHEEEICEDYLALDMVSGVNDIAALKDKFTDILSSFDSITYVLIICAGALTFIVLFNLTNINISERRRELATLKVLGFYDIELSQYIYRENIIITFIGILFGVLGGYWLNMFVVQSVEVDIVMFGREIFFPSFAKSILLAVLFAAIVNFIVHYKLRKIDMATSLKSVE